MSDPRISRVEVTRVTETSREVTSDLVALEEPLEIAVAWRADGEPREKTVAVTMRTPGDDYDLAAGFLFTEGLLRTPGDLESIRHWGSPNNVRVTLAPHARADLSKLDRHFYTTSSCGVCGKTSINALRVTTNQKPNNRAPVEASVIRSLPARLHESQSAFHATGGMHGAALLDRDGKLLRTREDIGRHNAVDKAIGSFIRENADPFADAILMVSSRGSFEIVQKAVMAGISIVAFIGGPSSLAIELAKEFNVTLIGFLRDTRFTVYSGEVR